MAKGTHQNHGNRTVLILSFPEGYSISSWEARYEGWMKQYSSAYCFTILFYFRHCSTTCSSWHYTTFTHTAYTYFQTDLSLQLTFIVPNLKEDNNACCVYCRGTVRFPDPYSTFLPVIPVLNDSFRWFFLYLLGQRSCSSIQNFNENLQVVR